jgi:hypothetical protein
MAKRTKGAQPRHPTVVRRVRDSRLKQLGEAQAFCVGALMVVNVRCGRKGCHCATGEGHPSNYLSTTVGGKKASRYVRREDLAEVRKMVGEYKRVKKLVKEISELTLELMAAEAHVRRKQRRRRPRR